MSFLAFLLLLRVEHDDARMIQRREMNMSIHLDKRKRGLRVLRFTTTAFLAVP